jgi:hypothetical protein
MGTRSLTCGCVEYWAEQDTTNPYTAIKDVFVIPCDLHKKQWEQTNGYN